MTRQIAIVGGGFCGTMVAVHLLRSAPNATSVTLFNAHYPLARGVAYSTSDPRHLLNVAARNMSATPDDLDDFVEWLGSRGEYRETPIDQLREKFVPRSIYGDYLKAQVWSARRQRGSGVNLTVVPEEVVDVIPSASRWILRTATGHRHEADDIVLATGQAPTAQVRTEGELAPESWIAEPWQPGALATLPRSGHVVLLGSGLTMVDLACSLLANSPDVRITAISRSGRLPKAHFRGIPLPSLVSSDFGKLSLPAIVRKLRLEAVQLQRDGLEPAMLVDKLRPMTQRIWKGWNAADRAAFLRGYRGTWNRLRHRMPQESSTLLEAALQTGRLSLTAGQVRHVEARAGRPLVHVLTEHGAREISADCAINCLGPVENFYERVAPLYQSLLEQGLVRLDDTGLGIQVSDDFSVIDQMGTPSNSLSALGPSLRGTLWESTAVPELRVEAASIAQRLLRKPTAQPETVEYCI